MIVWSNLLWVLMVIFLNTCSKDVQSSISDPEFAVQIPLAGNAWIVDQDQTTGTTKLTDAGIQKWDDNDDKIRIFFYSDKSGDIELGLKVRQQKGQSGIRVIFENKVNTITVQTNDWTSLPAGTVHLSGAGYHFIDLEGAEKEGDYFAEVSDLLISGMDSHDLVFVRDEFYWGRRGPSVHLNFPVPSGEEQVEWFYSELMIPTGQDVIGSYFMANGFAEGYFGIQVNSTEERRILFSVWSPYSTDNPEDIPEAYRIKLLKKGEGVTTGAFGNEGSGGQSYKVFPWKSDVTYGFLIRAYPVDSTTIYTAYFYDPEQAHWSLIARFARPKTRTYLKRLHSFLENFIPEQGIVARRGWYGNQWYYNASGWHEITETIFTADNTARKNNRLDDAGGSENNLFYLQNCGFTDLHTPIDAKFVRKNSGIPPRVDLNLLE